MKIIIAAVLLLPSLGLVGEADDLARRIITTAINPPFDNGLPGAMRQKADADRLGLTVDEMEEKHMTRAKAANALFHLKHFMLSDEAPEDVRLCYAITLLDTQIGYASILGDAQPEAKAVREGRRPNASPHRSDQPWDPASSFSGESTRSERQSRGFQ